METTTTTSRTRAALFVLLAVLTAGVIASTVLAALAFADGRNTLRLIERELEDRSQETQEDGVRISSYKVRSTTQISDAYRSGDASALNDKDRETLDMASEVLDEIVRDGMTDFEKERAVYDWMTANLRSDTGLLTVIPQTQADCDNPYGVLKYHNAVCVGYATTFRLFMQMLDIPCMVIHNTEQQHSWDLVQLDGDWYHTDVYSDVGTGSYAHFNMSDAMLSHNGQSWDTDFFPAATNLRYNIAYLDSEEGVDIYDIPARMRRAMDDGTTRLSFRYGKDFTEAQARLADQMLSDIQSFTWNLEEYLSFGIYYYFSPVDDGYLLTITIDRAAEPEDEGITDEEREKASEAVQDAFKDLTEGGGTLSALG